MHKALFWGALLLGAFCIDRFAPAWVQALAAVAALGWFVVATWWEAQCDPRR